MKSIKPGRGPSMMGGIMSIVVGIFGVIWTVAAAGMGAGIITLFGVVFIIMAVVMAIYNFKNATGDNRYSTFDIVDGDEEPDPLNEKYGKTENKKRENEQSDQNSYCPYCGSTVGDKYEFCSKCGRKLP